MAYGDILHLQIIKGLFRHELRVWRKLNYGAVNKPYEVVPFEEYSVRGSPSCIHLLWCDLSSLKDSQERNSSLTQGEGT